MDTSEPSGTSRIPVVIVVGCCFRYDAISAAAIDTFNALASDPHYSVTILTSYSNVPEQDVEIVRSATELLMHPCFLAAELIIYHFGIYHSLLDVMLIGNRRARQAAFFHNVTPAEHMPPSEAETIAKSYRQLNNLRFVDSLWPVSRTNAEMLTELDFDPTRIDIIPLSVGAPEIASLTPKSAERIEILFLGRIVRAKGIVDLIHAIAAMPRETLPPFRLRIAGSLSHSHADCVALVKSLLTEKRLAHCVDFLGTVSDEERDNLLESSHVLAIPSYHEGFCKPVIEGLRVGCVPIGYAVHNLRYIADGLGRMLPAGDVPALSNALACLISELHAIKSNPAQRIALDGGTFSPAEFERAARLHVAQFEPDHVHDLMRRHVDMVLHSERSPVTPFPWLASTSATR